MSAVQYYLLESNSAHLIKLLDRLKEASTTTHVTVSLVEGEEFTRDDRTRSYRPGQSGTGDPVNGWRPAVRYAVRLTAEQIADLATNGLYDFDGCRAMVTRVAPAYQSGPVQTKDKKFRSETPLLNPRYTGH